MSPSLAFLAFVCIAAFVASLVGIWIRVSLRANILDRPTHRSSHAKATPRGGGVGIVAGVLGGAILAGTFGAGESGLILRFGTLSLAIASISFIDDVRPLPSLVRLLFHVSVAAAGVAAFGTLPDLTGWWLDGLSLPEWLLAIITVVWLVGLTNVYNFMDGIDGIAGGQGLVAGLAWMALGWTRGDMVVGWVGLALAASCTGFLLFNWSPARVFMGDVGSAFLGFAFGVLPLLAQRDGGSSAGHAIESVGIPYFGVMAVWPFLADGIVTFVRRVKKGENVLEAHRSHLYQRLVIAGWSHAHVSMLYIGWAALSVLVGAAFFQRSPVWIIPGAAFAVGSLAGMYALVKYFELAELRSQRLVRERMSS